MNWFDLFVIAVGLSMDAFAVSVCKGLAVPRVGKRHVMTVGMYFGGFQALMPLIGYLLGKQFEAMITSRHQYRRACHRRDLRLPQGQHYPGGAADRRDYLCHFRRGTARRQRLRHPLQIQGGACRRHYPDLPWRKDPRRAPFLRRLMRRRKVLSERLLRNKKISR